LEEDNMAATERATATITARIPKELRGELDALSKSTGRNKNALVEEALRRFVEVERWQIASIEERLRRADAGDFATDEEMDELYKEFNIPRPSSQDMSATGRCGYAGYAAPGATCATLGSTSLWKARMQRGGSRLASSRLSICSPISKESGDQAGSSGLVNSP